MSVSQPSDRPETSTYIRDMHRDGYGLLAIYNTGNAPGHAVRKLSHWTRMIAASALTYPRVATL